MVMTSMICVTLKMTGLTSMHHAPSFAALTSVVHLPTSKIIVADRTFVVVNETGNCLNFPKMNEGELSVKKRKYSDEFLKYGFTSVVVAGIEKPQCVIC